MNTDGGDIIIGVDDSGSVIGVDDVDETSKKLSDMITSQIEPNPQDIISSEIIYDEGKTLIVKLLLFFYSDMNQNWEYEDIFQSDYNQWIETIELLVKQYFVLFHLFFVRLIMHHL